ncbi:hypothetical protein KY092_08370 [Natronomonas gomsonensis]|uniref:hypothetical protein n=1 Tax=Natronomonas gomsonensis TaxID=1046043 RepID=UPI0020CA7CE4|nr:hypothetical protein [Natronomonas gomsonensis]MCY4730572.1 hypothetical protein [Natronomonas gomsonensis]
MGSHRKISYLIAMAVLFCLSISSAAAEDLTVSDGQTTTLCGNVTDSNGDLYENAVINGTVEVCEYDGSSGGKLNLTVQNTIKVHGTINATGAGYQGGENNTISRSGYASYKDYQPGNSGSGQGSGGAGGAEYGDPNAANGGGAGFGGEGVKGGDPADGDGSGGPAGSTYGTKTLDDLYLGSGGGSGGVAIESGEFYGTAVSGSGGDGGGAVYLNGYNLSVSGQIAANGEKGRRGRIHNESSYGVTVYAGGGGGGSGGSIKIHGYDVNLRSGSVINASGDYGGKTTWGQKNTEYGCCKGTGGGGRISTSYGQYEASGTLDVEGGNLGTTYETAGYPGNHTITDARLEWTINDSKKLVLEFDDWGEKDIASHAAVDFGDVSEFTNSTLVVENVTTPFEWQPNIVDQKGLKTDKDWNISVGTELDPSNSGLKHIVHSRSNTSTQVLRSTARVDIRGSRINYSVKATPPSGNFTSYLGEDNVSTQQGEKGTVDLEWDWGIDEIETTNTLEFQSYSVFGLANRYALRFENTGERDFVVPSGSLEQSLKPVPPENAEYCYDCEDNTFNLSSGEESSEIHVRTYRDRFNRSIGEWYATQDSVAGDTVSITLKEVNFSYNGSETLTDLDWKGYSYVLSNILTFGSIPQNLGLTNDEVNLIRGEGSEGSGLEDSCSEINPDKTYTAGNSYQVEDVVTCSGNLVTGERTGIELTDSTGAPSVGEALDYSMTVKAENLLNRSINVSVNNSMFLPEHSELQSSETSSIDLAASGEQGDTYENSSVQYRQETVHRTGADCPSAWNKSGSVCSVRLDEDNTTEYKYRHYVEVENDNVRSLPIKGQVDTSKFTDYNNRENVTWNINGTQDNVRYDPAQGNWTVETDFGNSSLHQGTWYFETSYGVEDSTEGYLGGSRPSGENETNYSVQFTSQEYYTVAPGSSSRIYFTVWNYEKDENTISIETRDTQACSYFSLQSNFVGDEFSKNTSLNIPGTRQDLGAGGADVILMAKVNLPNRTELQNQGLGDTFTCRFDTGAGIGEAQPLNLTVNAVDTTPRWVKGVRQLLPELPDTELVTQQEICLPQGGENTSRLQQVQRYLEEGQCSGQLYTIPRPTGEASALIFGAFVFAAGIRSYRGRVI